MRRTDRAIVVALCLAVGGAAAQGSPSPQPAAGALPAQEQERLAALRQRLDALAADERIALRVRVAEWDALPEAGRRSRRDAWQAWQAIPHDERMRMREARAAFEAMPLERQRELRAAFDALDANLRRGWLLGPVLGVDWPRLHALFAQVPGEEREALLVALRALAPQGRSDLAMLAQRTPPEQRQALRDQLLAQPAGTRDAWLRRRVDPL